MAVAQALGGSGHPSRRPFDPHTGRDALGLVVETIESIVLSQERTVRLILSALLARGHVLIEDVPGVGKTTLARTMARVLGCAMARIQCTADLLPGDIVGVQVWRDSLEAFEFRPGPVFSDLVLADEINRAPPKTQSALLEAMAERRVTVDETTYPLPAVFSVIATQNPAEHHGAYPLPESQMDRFAVRVAMGYPTAQAEKALIMDAESPQRSLEELESVLSGPNDFTALQALSQKVHVSEPVIDYILALVQATRGHPDVVLGCSPRGAAQFASLVRAWCFVHGRDFVRPDDVQHLAAEALGHRMSLATGTDAASATSIVTELIEKTPVPR